MSLTWISSHEWKLCCPVENIKILHDGFKVNKSEKMSISHILDDLDTDEKFLRN